jgi:hypothetical protein
MRANGIDFSKWAPEYNYIPNTVHFVIQRLSYGLTTDERYEQHKESIREVPVREAYHYYEMTHPWKEQVDKFLALAEGYDNVWWDAEENSFGNVFGSRFANETAEALRYLRQVFPNAGLYCNRDIYYLLEHKLDPAWLAEIPLWIADPQNDGIDWYIKGNEEPYWGVWRGGVWVEFKRPWNSWTYWQTSFSGDPARYGIVDKKAVDEDVFNGTFEELLALRYKSRPGCLEKLKEMFR